MTPDNVLDLAFPPEECIHKVGNTTYGPALHCEEFFGASTEHPDPNRLGLLPHMPYWFGQAG